MVAFSYVKLLRRTARKQTPVGSSFPVEVFEVIKFCVFRKDRNKISLKSIETVHLFTRDTPPTGDSERRSKQNGVKMKSRLKNYRSEKVTDYWAAWKKFEKRFYSIFSVPYFLYFYSTPIAFPRKNFLSSKFSDFGKTFVHQFACKFLCFLQFWAGILYIIFF